MLVFLLVAVVGGLSIAAAVSYAGHWVVFMLFTLTANALLFNGFRRSALFFDTFIGVFFWLGFWLKTSVRVAFANGMFAEPVGAFNGSAGAFDQALLVSSSGFVALLVASLVRERLFVYPDRPATCSESGIFRLYRAYRKSLVLGFLLIVVLAASSNVWLGIYQRGMVAQTVLPFGLNGVYKWLLQFGFASISALIIRFEIEINRNLSLMAVVPPILESLFSNVSLLSRGMVLNSSALAVGGLRLLGAMKCRVPLVRFIIAGTVFVVLFVASVFAVNYLRASWVIEVDTSTSISMVPEMTSPLFMDRWVGIEGVMAVSSSDKLGWSLWREAWQEKFRAGELSLYDRYFIDSPYTHPAIDKTKNHFVSLPGIIAFLYYLGSLPFLFFALLGFGLVAAAFEIATYRYCGENWILCSLFAQVVAFRYASFGYVPSQSYLLFGTLLLNVLIIFTVDRALNRFFSWQSRTA
ncbi:MAG: hypothetical protein CVU24_11765 [Betaproteobacteria bacterium HGW-Betaproteobacteria-18]|nr:MAG: hypothetical protein CVU24_11765 [Betaproteobacteria bacterium HGW-Betaproteobacteria-18]